MMNYLNEKYQPNDLTSIKKNSDIKFPHDLENEISKICETLKDLNSRDWKDRMEAMKKIQSIVVTTKITKFPNFIQSINKLHFPLTAQMTDQRSQLIKEAAKTISILAEVLQDDFESLAIKFISANSLIKLVQNTNKIISDQGHISVLAILYNVVSYKLISKIYEEIRNKNPHVRMKIAQYFLVILNTYPEEVLERTIHLIEDFLIHDLSDAKHEVRQISRMCFLVYKEIFPNRAKTLFPTLDFSVQKAILDEDENTLKESFSRLSVPSRSKDPNDSQRTYQHLYGGEKNPKLLNDELEEQSQPSKAFGNKASVQSEQIRKHPLSEQNLDARELITPLPEGGKTSKNFVDIPKNDTSFEQMLGKGSDPNIVPQFSKQIKTKTQASQQDDQRPSRTSEEVKSKLKCLKSKQLSKKNESSYSNFSNSNNQDKDDESISSIQEVSNQVSIISDARKIRDFEESGSVQESVKNKNTSGRVATKKQNFFSTGNDTRVTPNEYGGFGSGELRQVAGGSELNQQIQMLLEKAQKESWSERLDAFYGIQYILNDWLMIVGEASANNQKLTIQQLNVTPENLKAIMQCLTDHLSDSHFKVVIVVQESLCSLFQVFHEIFHPYLPKLIQKLLKNVTDKKEVVCQSANVLLNLFQQIFGGDQLVPILLKLLDKSQHIQNKVLISCLEVLMVLLKDAYQYSMVDENVKTCVLKISVIAGENSANKSVTLPIIGALLTLRDKNLKATMMSLSQLDNKNLDIIKRLSHFYAPDLEENICEHVYHILENQEPVEESPRILEEKKNKLLARNQHSYPIDVPAALNKKNEQNSCRKNYEEEKSSRSQIEKKLGDVDSNLKEEEEDTMSFLLLESQIKKQVSATAPEQYLSEIFTSHNGFKWILSQNNEVKFDIVKKLLGLVQEKNSQIQFWNDHLQDVFHTLIGILNSQLEGLDKNDSSNELLSLKEQSFELLKQIIRDFFSKLFETTKTPQKHSLLDSLIESIIFNYNENKYISKKAEQAFDQLILSSSLQQPFFSYISKSLLKIYSHQNKASNCLSALVKFQTKTIKHQQKQYFVMHAQDVFNNFLLPHTNHQNAEVRKNVVFCLVEMRILMGVEDFKPFYEKMPISQQKLVNIYIERKNTNNGYSPLNLSQSTTHTQQAQVQQSQTGGKIL